MWTPSNLATLLKLVVIVPSMHTFKFGYLCCTAGTTVYNALLEILTTLLVLKVLSLQISTDCTFPVEFTPKVVVMDLQAVTPPKFKQKLAKATEFIVSADKKYPSLYSRLEMGSNWEDVLDHTIKLFV